jgi:hypothetical protein
MDKAADSAAALREYKCHRLYHDGQREPNSRASKARFLQLHYTHTYTYRAHQGVVLTPLRARQFHAHGRGLSLVELFRVTRSNLRTSLRRSTPAGHSRMSRRRGSDSAEVRDKVWRDEWRSVTTVRMERDCPSRPFRTISRLLTFQQRYRYTAVFPKEGCHVHRYADHKL